MKKKQKHRKKVKVIKKRAVKKKELIDPKEIEKLILNISGEEGLTLYKLLKMKNNVSEFILADKLKRSINQIRNLLYKFDVYNLITSTRKKDRKKGWYVYYWTFVEQRAKDAIILIKKQELNKLKSQLEREKSYNFFMCPKKCIRLTYETSMENQFQCLECGSILMPEDNTKMVKNLEKEIDNLNKEILKYESK